MSRITCLVARIGHLLTQRKWTLGVAESCTGGLVSHSITNLPGSSGFFLGGVVAYANEVKMGVLGVSSALLAAHGAVSHQVALSMAQGVKRVLGSDVGVATTGIAGPTGESPGKPVGTVFVAVSTPLGDVMEHYAWGSDREGNKRLSAEAALALLERRLTG